MATHAGSVPRHARLSTAVLLATLLSFGLLGTTSASGLRVGAHDLAAGKLAAGRRSLSQAPAPATAGASPLERAAVPPAHPLNLVGQLRNGCTAFLVGPCHVVTVAHCVHDPAHGIWWPGLEFSAGRNGPGAWDPFGRVSWRATEVPEGWKLSGGSDEAFDFALVVLAEPLGRRLGWMRLPGPAGIGGGEAAGGGAAEGAQAEAAGGCSRAALEALAAASPWVPVGVAGYPDDRDNGTLWAQACRLRLGGGGEALGGAGPADGKGGTGSPGAGGGAGREPQARLRLLRHGCATRGGNSGSPLWLQTADGPGGGAPCALAMHVAGRTRSTYDTAGRRTHSSSHGLAVSLAGAAGDWLRDMVAKHGDC